MADKVLMIALTPTMENGKIARWNKKEGDIVKQGDVICEIETDKSSMEYESFNDGTLLKIIVDEGGDANIGDLIAVLGTSGEDISHILDEATSNNSASDPKGESSESSAASAVSAQEKATATPVTSDIKEQKQPSEHVTGRVKASPLAKKLAEKRGIDIRSVIGSGPYGRIVQKDVENHTEASTHGPLTHIGDAGQDTEIKVEGVRAIIAQRLSESKFGAPHFYLKVNIRSEKIVELRNIANAKRESKLSMNAFFMKLTAEAIKHHPIINSSWQSTKITQYASIDIGLAVDLGRGLMTPIVRNCGNKGVEQIDFELQQLIKKVREGTISASEYSGATFSISNLGSFGVDEFTAIINPPGSAILAVGKNRKEPVVNDAGIIEVGNLITFTLSCDHRVIDGAAAARFLADMQSIFENPAIALV